LFQLGAQELRGDEAFDALFSAQEVGVIVEQLRLEQPYPPLFHAGLHYWLDLLGRTEIAQRLPALLAGVLLVPVAFQLARFTLGKTTALIAAFLVAINPFYIWHAQDGRMYSLLALLSVASMWLVLLLLQKKGARTGAPLQRSSLVVGLGYWAVTVLALLTHYFAWWVLLAENVVAALVLARAYAARRWEGGGMPGLGQRSLQESEAVRHHDGAHPDGGAELRSLGKLRNSGVAGVMRWLTWQAVVVLPLVPWLVFAAPLLASHTSGWIPAMGNIEILRRSLLTFSLGSTLQETPRLIFSLFMGGLFLVGCVFRPQVAPAEDRAGRQGAGAAGLRPVDMAGLGIDGRVPLLVYAGVPLLATIVLSLLRPAFDEKYLIAIAACYLILVAHGLHFLGSRRRSMAVVAGVAIVAASAWSLVNYYLDPAYAKGPNWRTLVETLEARSAEGDAVVLNYPDPGFNYYYDGDLSVELIPDRAGEPYRRVGRQLSRLAASSQRIWLIPGRDSAWDAEGLVESWLGRHADLVAVVQPLDRGTIGSQRLELYHTPRTFLEQMQPVGLEVGHGARLLGYRIAGEDRASPGPGDTFLLTLYWESLAAMDFDYSVFVHVADAEETIWGQDDGQPVGGTYPTSAWVPGEIVVDQHRLQIDPEAPPGSYRLMTGMYDGSNGQRLTVEGSSDIVDDDRIVLRMLEIPPR
jgi:hypothetical protein